VILIVPKEFSMKFALMFFHIEIALQFSIDLVPMGSVPMNQTAHVGIFS
jgi:hypothetical protein